MNANDLPDEIPEHLRTDANATFLEQVAMDLADAGTEPTAEELGDALAARIERNREIAQSVLEA